MASPRTYVHGERPTLRIIPSPVKLLKTTLNAQPAPRDDVDRILGRREASRPAGGGRVEKEEPPTFSTAAALPFLCVSPPFKNWRKIFAMKIVSSIPPEPPAHLSASARRWWQTTVETYELEEHHLRLLQLVCEAWDRSQMARELLDREGLTVPGREGGTRPHPAIYSRTFQPIRERAWLHGASLPR
jgi:hypothetical protein